MNTFSNLPKYLEARGWTQIERSDQRLEFVKDSYSNGMLLEPETSVLYEDSVHATLEALSGIEQIPRKTIEGNIIFLHDSDIASKVRHVVNASFSQQRSSRVLVTDDISRIRIISLVSTLLTKLTHELNRIEDDIWENEYDKFSSVHSFFVYENMLIQMFHELHLFEAFHVWFLAGEMTSEQANAIVQTYYIAVNDVYLAIQESPMLAIEWIPNTFTQMFVEQ